MLLMVGKNTQECQYQNQTLNKIVLWDVVTTYVYFQQLRIEQDK